MNISFPVSGLRNTAYTQFYIQQLTQTNSTRSALLRTNISFDYDAPGKIIDLFCLVEQLIGMKLVDVRF